LTTYQSFSKTVAKNFQPKPGMTKEKKHPKVDWKRLKGTTNFYPTYVDGNLDKVTPAAATYSTQFQTVIPRYNLSMSETRNAGTGPTFLETAYQPPTKRVQQHEESTETTPESVEEKFKTPRHKKKKIRTDFWE
jgi:hypothetical protein